MVRRRNGGVVYSSHRNMAPNTPNPNAPLLIRALIVLAVGVLIGGGVALYRLFTY